MLVNVLNDPWLPDINNSFIISSHAGLIEATVNCLMKEGSREWDADLIKDLERDQRSCLFSSERLLSLFTGL